MVEHQPLSLFCFGGKTYSCPGNPEFWGVILGLWQVPGFGVQMCYFLTGPSEWLVTSVGSFLFHRVFPHGVLDAVEAPARHGLSDML